MIEKLKTIAIGFLVALFNPYPTKIAAAVAVLATLANLMGVLCAFRRGERVSGNKIMRGNLRIVLYFICFGALHLAIGSTYPNILSAIFGAIAGHEFMLVIEKGICAGVIPSGLTKALQDAYARLTGSGRSNSSVQ
jgi:hypothetical protein